MADSLKLGSHARVELHDLAAGGEAVGRLDNFVLFVPGGAPGDEVEVEICELKKNYGRGKILRVLKPSRRRVEPPCRIYHQCGGCQLQHLDYDAQLFYKTKMVRDALQHLSDLHGVTVRPCRRMPDPWHYRNKVQAVVAAKPYLKESGKPSRSRPYIGLYARGTHRVVKMDECAIQDDLNNQVLQAAREAMERLRWSVYDEKDGTGLVRYLVTRASLAAREVLLVVVAAQPRLPQVQEFLTSMRSRVPELVGVLLNLNPHKTNVVLGNRTRLVWGQDHLTEVVDGLKFHISPTSFFQVNTQGLKMLYEVLDRYCPLRGKETVLDLFCGVGSLTLYLARKARRVLGIDYSPSAIEDAIVNCDLNEIRNADFQAGPSEKLLPQLYREGQRFQLAVIDPPRKGCDPQVLSTLARMRVPDLVYVSCNPATLARDLASLAELGYRIDEVQPLDMFPQTYHVECVARLTSRERLQPAERAESPRPETLP
ncbi:MAG: 23S rRNA (uracil(1939)-C(5))-methyltransferase RlmD [Armatimonadetes bacterium]|nr:23S rRNA (uracil(1939)-C(5))-methyltransferase RlmD [Armatimonadota bacterium]